VVNNIFGENFTSPLLTQNNLPGGTATIKFGWLEAGCGMAWYFWKAAWCPL